MIARKLPFITDFMTPVPARLLKTTLVDFIPYPNIQVNHANKLAIGYHLVYFPPQTRLSSLYADGTDPLHSPGPPFTRRMWAGGNMKFLKPLKVDLSAFHLNEKIIDVQFKGEADKQKIFVTIERAIHQGNIPKKLTTDTDAHILETRNIVFMREDSQSPSGGSSQLPARLLTPTKPPDYSIRVIPTPALLFRFSALTFNAHAIHLDKKFCQGIEGHRNLLVHGPLTLVLMLEVLKLFLAKTDASKPTARPVESIRAVEYRNLAPLYAEEEMKICVRRKTQETNAGSFDIWIEGKEGGYAVKGIVRTSIEVPHEKDAKQPSYFDEGVGRDKEIIESRDIDPNSPVVEIATRDPTIPEDEEASVGETSTGDEKIQEKNDLEDGVDEDHAPYFQR